MLNITLSPSEPDPAIYLIGHVAKTISTLRDLIEVLEKEGKNKAIRVPQTYVDSMNNGCIDFLVKALSFQVNFEPDRFVGASFFDACHVTLRALPYLPTTRDEKSGHTILHHRSIYENRTPALVDESVKLVARYSPDCCSVKDNVGQLPLHAAAQVDCILDLNESMDRLVCMNSYILTFKCITNADTSVYVCMNLYRLGFHRLLQMMQIIKGSFPFITPVTAQNRTHQSSIHYWKLIKKAQL